MEADRASERATRIVRRLITVPAFIAAFVVGATLLPVIVPFAAGTDMIRGSRFAVTRAVLFGVYYFGCETAGILASGWLWLRRLLPPTIRDEDWLDAHFTLQCWWASTLLAGARHLFGMHIEIDGDDVVSPGGGPFLLLLRHVSVGDTLLAAVFLSARRRHRLRYVLKRELLWDPCLDIVGHRLPNCFVQRGARSSAAEIERVRALARDLGPDDAVLLYPEGTRFTTEKRRAILHRLESSGRTHELKRARALRHVLPPRPGGALAILDTCPNIAVVCCAHIGFEGTMRLTDLLSGALVGSRVRVAFWRAPTPPMLPDRDARIGWLFDRWQEVDRWVDAARQERTDPTTTPP